MTVASSGSYLAGDGGLPTWLWILLGCGLGGGRGTFFSPMAGSFGIRMAQRLRSRAFGAGGAMAGVCLLIVRAP